MVSFFILLLLSLFEMVIATFIHHNIFHSLIDPPVVEQVWPGGIRTGWLPWGPPQSGGFRRHSTTLRPGLAPSQGRAGSTGWKPLGEEETATAGEGMRRTAQVSRQSVSLCVVMACSCMSAWSIVLLQVGDVSDVEPSGKGKKAKLNKGE